MLIIGAPIGNGVANRILFSNLNVSLDVDDGLVFIKSSGNVGIGVTTPTAKLTIAGPGGSIGLFQIGKTGDSFSNLFTTTYPSLGSDTMYGVDQFAGDGGASLNGFSDANLQALNLIGHVGATSPTVPAVVVFGFRWDGGSSRANMTGTHQIFSVRQGISTDLFTVLANGNVGIGTTSAGSGLEMGNDLLFAQDVNAGLTAGTTQTQAGGLALTAQINQFSVVANTNDTAVLPALPATGSLMCAILNDGANSMRIFPASGDDLGAGVDTQDAVNIPAATMRTYVSYNGTNWRKYLSE